MPSFNIDWRPIFKAASMLEFEIVEGGELTAFAEILKKKTLSREYHSVAGITKRLGDRVREEVLETFDRTKGPKGKKKVSGQLRAAIRTLGPFLNNSGDVVVLVGGQLPFYWKFQEEGARASMRRQGYAVFNARGTPGGTGFTLGAETANISRSYMDLPNSMSNYRERRQQRNTFFGRPVSLVPKKKAELARLKNKVTLEFMHPGIKPRHFFAAGLSWLEAHGSAFFAQEFAEVMLRAQFEANHARLKVLR